MPADLATHEPATRAIRDTIERCFFALDARDEPLLRSCFTAAGTARYHRGSGQAVDLPDVDAIARYNIDRMRSYTASTHLIANCLIEVKGDEARAQTHAIAYVIVGAQVLARGLKYIDDIVQVGDHWLIRHRDHGSVWQFNAPLVQPTVTHPR